MKNILKIKNWIYALLLVIPFMNFAQEGTKQVSPDQTKLSGLMYWPDRGYGSFIDATEENQIKFTIKNFNTEKFYFGFSWTSFLTTAGATSVLNYSTINEFMYYRILDSDGTVVQGPTLLPRTGVNAAGQITSYAEAVAGPKIGSNNPSGYNPIIFTPTKNDTYIIESWRGTSVTNSTRINTTAVSPLFDFSVASGTTLIPGRVFATKWSLANTTANTNNPTRYFTSTLAASPSFGTPSFYVYTDKLNVLKLSFPSIIPYSYTIGANNYGVNNSGNFLVDRKSVNNTTATLAGGFNIFLNAPDVTIFPYNTTIAAAPSFASPAVSPIGACNVAPFNINFNVVEAGDHRIVISGTGISTRTISLFDLTLGSKQIVWDGNDGAGVAIPASTSLTFQLTAFSDRFNLPAVDVEGNPGGISVTAIAPAGSTVSNLFWDDSDIASGTNNSTTGSASPTHSWSISSLFGDERTINTWGYVNQQTTSTISTLLCADVTLTKTVDNATPAIGSNVTFTITASNLTSGSTATDVVVNDVLPAGYTLVSATPSAGTWTNPNWTIGNLANGSPRTLTIIATVNASTNYTNVATISTSKSEINLNNNAAFAKVTPAAGSAISVSGTCEASGASAGYQLNNAHSGAIPSGATLVWYNNAARTGTSIVNSLATVSGDYYAFYFDAVGNCYSTASAKVTVTIPNCLNAVADSFTATGSVAIVGSTSVGNVLTNDTFNSATGGTATVSNVAISVTTPAVAIISGKPVPSLNTTTGAVAIPAGTPAGTYTIVYKICEKVSAAPCDSDTVTIVVSAPEIIAVADTFSTTAAGGTTGSVLTNDTYNLGSATTSNVTASQDGTWTTGITLNTDGTITVAAGTPPGSYALHYSICDKLNPTNCKTIGVTVNVTKAVDAVADNFSATGAQAIGGAATVGNVLANDTYNGGAAGTATTSNVAITVTTAATPVTSGAPVPTLNTGTGVVSIPVGTPAGVYSIIYQICDLASGTPCESATTQITVSAAPIVAVTETVSVEAGITTTTSLFTNDILNGNTPTSSTVNVTLVSTTLPNGVTLNLDGTFTVAAETPSGTYNLKYKICEKLNSLNCSEVTSTINVTNNNPVAVADPSTVDEDATVTLTPLANDTDVDGNTLSITSINGTTLTPGTAQEIAVTNGTVNITDAGVITFTAALNYNGSVSFPYVISDGNGGTATANQNITVTAVNDNPVAVADPSTVDEDATVTLTPLANDTDVDGNTLSITSINGTTLTPGTAQEIAVTNGTVNITDAGVITFTAALNYNGSVSFPYVISDGNGGTSTANQNITVTAVNDNPVAVADPSAVDEDATVTLTPLANDTDVDGNTLSITSINGTTLTPGTAQVIAVTNGTVTITDAGVITFTAALNYNGSVSFPYVISDGNGGTATANQNITVTAVNDNPVAVADSYTVDEGATVTLTPLANDTDVDGNTLTVTSINGITLTPGTEQSIVVTNGTVNITAGGIITFTGNLNYNGSVSFPYVISDGNGGTSTANQNITVTQAPFCYLPGSIDLSAGNTLDTSVGISSLDRAGAVSAWPQARKSGWIALEAKTKGFVINRVRFVNGLPVNGNGDPAITTPVEGMMVYDTTNDCLKMYTTTDDGVSFAWFCLGTQTCP